LAKSKGASTDRPSIEGVSDGESAAASRSDMPQSRRGLDRIFLPAVVLVMVTAVWVANRSGEEEASLPVPDFSMPGIELEIPFEMPYKMVRFKRHEAQHPDLDLRHGQIYDADGKSTELVIVEVRDSLLASSARDESDIETEVSRIAIR